MRKGGGFTVRGGVWFGDRQVRCSSLWAISHYGRGGGPIPTMDENPKPLSPQASQPADRSINHHQPPATHHQPPAKLPTNHRAQKNQWGVGDEKRGDVDGRSLGCLEGINSTREAAADPDDEHPGPLPATSPPATKQASHPAINYKPTLSNHQPTNQPTNCRPPQHERG